METKTYYAKDLSLALDQIKQELGDDAIIVKSRRTKQGGFLGMFKTSVYEVVVSYDPDDNKKQNDAPKKKDADNPLGGFGRDASRRLASAVIAAKSQEEAKKNRNPYMNKAANDVLDRSAREAMPRIEQQQFAQLIQMAGAVDEPQAVLENAQPAWITPNQKLGAYMSMRQDNPANTAYTPKQPVQPVQPIQPVQQVQPVQPVQQYNVPNINEIAKPHEVTPNLNVPEKRKRGRPRKSEVEARNALDGTKHGEAINSRLDVVEQMLRSLMNDIRSPYADVPAKADKGMSETEAESAILKDYLIEQDVDAPVADELIKTALKLKSAYGYTLNSALERALREVLGKPKYLRGSTKTARTVMLVGPTGVGKTTTLVKLAAGCVFERKARVAIINADIFRVGAQDQLKAYAKILDVPIKTIYETAELRSAVNSFTDYDFVFIDTCGKASTDKGYQNEIKELLSTNKIQDTYLVVSSTTSGRVCKQIIDSYDFIDDYKTILTKIDESGTVGGAVNLAFYSGHPLSYVTIGQNVPDDISKVNVEDVIKQLMRES